MSRVFWRRRREEALGEAIDGHLRMAIRERIASGESPADAEAAARRQFGNVSLVKEITRDGWGWNLVDEVARDTRHAVRALARRSTFAVTAVLTLALAIGANIAIFNVIDRVILHPLDVPDPARLVTFQSVVSDSNGRRQDMAMDWERYQRVRGMSTMESVAASADLRGSSARMVLSAPDAPARSIEGTFITANCFRVVGAPPAFGRDFESSDDTPTGPPAVILSDRFWREHFAGDSRAVGRTLQIDGIAAVVVGVAARTFVYTPLGTPPPDVFLPLMTLVTMALAVSVILVSGLLAALLPTRRALRIDINDILRAD